MILKASFPISLIPSSLLHVEQPHMRHTVTVHVKHFGVELVRNHEMKTEKADRPYMHYKRQ